MYTLLYSVKQKSPELEIPEGVFYDQIPGYNLYIESKNRDTGVLYDMMIYDVSRGFENSSIILADSGKMSISANKTHLFLELWSGESFENLKDAASGMKNVPYRRENFDIKEIMVPFDANFNRMDEQGMRSQYIGKNMAELNATIDSVQQRVDSVGGEYATTLRETSHLRLSPYSITHDTANVAVKVLTPDVAMTHAVDVDSVFRGSSSGVGINYLQSALSKAQRNRQEFEYRALVMADELRLLRRHAIELQKKFTLSFACIIFFFIGAPLGAIIRKGGLGTPLVISVFLFIFYYIIDNMGYKLARDGKWPVWQGMWLSAAVLLPLGIFFTYKAVNDSAVFNKDAYLNFFRRFFGVNEVRKVEMKDIVMDPVRPALAVERLGILRSMVSDYLQANPASQSYVEYWRRGYDRESLHALRDYEENLVDRLTNSRDKMVIIRLMDMPILRSLWLLKPGLKPWFSNLMIALAPVGVPLWLYGRHIQKQLRHELTTVSTVSAQLITLIENGKDKA
ncbi:MAG: LptF/LptG family permease, partial [Duncaniella sp.]|nr:LptF/LptG family permease [Duncaniella sp.]